jgi:predicted GNAT superfamily acetyltransferase
MYDSCWQNFGNTISDKDNYTRLGREHGQMRQSGLLGVMKSVRGSGVAVISAMRPKKRAQTKGITTPTPTQVGW